MGKFIPIVLITFIITFTGCAAKSIQKEDPILKETKREEVKPIGPKKRIGVVAFENKTKYGERLGGAAADILITELARTGRFIVVERGRLDKIMTEEELGMTGIADPKTATRLGKILGLNAIIIGAISQFGVKTFGSDYLVTQSKTQIAEATVDIRLVDTDTGQVLYADSGEGIAKRTVGEVLGLGTKAGYDETLEGNALRSAITGFVDKIISQMDKKTWSCRVVHIKTSTGEVFINAGKESALSLGIILNIFHPGQEIKDPLTGNIIGYDEAPVGRMKVERYFGEDGSVGKMLSSGMPSVNDVCRLAE